MISLGDKQAKRIGGIIRQLASSEINQVGNAKQKLDEILRDRDMVLAVAERFEAPAGKYTEEEVLEIANRAKQKGLQEGIEIGKAQAQAAPHVNGYRAPNSSPSEHDMAMFCDARLNQLDDWYQEFIPSIIKKRIRWGVPLTAPQRAKLEEAYHQLGGR
jgi:hypothetical protein